MVLNEMCLWGSRGPWVPSLIVLELGFLLVEVVVWEYVVLGVTEVL